MIVFWCTYLKTAPSETVNKLKEWGERDNTKFPDPKTTSISALITFWKTHDCWAVVIPGIADFVNKRKGNYKFGMQALMSAGHIQCLFYKEKSQTATTHTSRFNARSWRSRVKTKEQVDLDQLVGERKLFADDARLGPTSILGFKGIVNIECLLREKVKLENAVNEVTRLKTGEGAAKNFFDHRAVIAIDLGVKNMMGATVSFGTFDADSKLYKGKFLKHLFSTHSYYSAARFHEIGD